MSLDDLDWNDPNVTVRPALARPKTCRRHVWETNHRTAIDPEDGHAYTDAWVACAHCGKHRDVIASVRGLNNRKRGNDIERQIAKKLGLRRTGQYGGKDDLSGELFKAQVKSGGAFSERYWNWLKSVPVDAAQTPLLVVTDAPGPGYKRRGFVVIDLDDWADLHGDAAAV